MQYPKRVTSTMRKRKVKAPVGSAGSTDFGGSQKHVVANQAGAEGVDHLALTASQKTSEASPVGGGGGGSGGMPLNEQRSIPTED